MKKRSPSRPWKVTAASAFAGETAQLEQEVHVPGLAAHLAVGDSLEVHILLQLTPSRMAASSALPRSAAHLALPSRRGAPERGRVQQAADVIGTKRRSRIAMVSPRKRGPARAARLLGVGTPTLPISVTAVVDLERPARLRVPQHDVLNAPSSRDGVAILAALLIGHPTARRSPPPPLTRSVAVQQCCPEYDRTSPR